MNSQNHDWVWWKHGIVYHIYPLSFFDSNQDGFGDLEGITQKLDYLEMLGIDAIWLSPIYDSPMVDFGYDVRDYRKIDAHFGNLADFQKLLYLAHKRGIRVIMDMILNHTSDTHPWFLESKASQHNPKRDWYIWRKGQNSGPPNNWKTAFGSDAWEFDETTQEYYLHTFFKEQPDLNWRSKKMRKAFFKELQFWLDMGVDGFRLDVINMIGKDKKLRDNPSYLFFLQKPYFNINHNRSHKIVRRLRKLVNKYNDRMLVGEIYAWPPGDSKSSGSYLGNGQDGLHMAFDFSIIFKKWQAKAYAQAITEQYKHIPKDGWPSIVFSNHDLSRSISKLGSGLIQQKKAKIEATLLLTLRGTPFIYYGEEIGMKNVKIRKNQIKDPLGKRFWPVFNGRDKGRTPMQWNELQHSGFSERTPWLPISEHFLEDNVDRQIRNPDSILNFYIALIEIRKQRAVFQHGDFKWIAKGEKDLLIYSRTDIASTIIIMLNFSSKSQKSGHNSQDYNQIISSTNTKIDSDLEIILLPYEAKVLETIRV